MVGGNATFALSSHEAKMLRSEKKRVTLILLCAAMLVGLFCNTLHAQIDVGRVTGTVKDASGAVVPNAQITLTNEATSVSQQITSSSDGTYVFESVPPATYTLKVEASGFKEYVDTGIEVHVQRSVTTDITLAVGAPTQSVTVTSAAPLLQAEDATLSKVVSSTTANALPLNGREVLYLAELAPGSYLAPGAVSSSTTLPSASGQSIPNILANGSEVGQVDFRFNGVDDNEEVFGGVTVAPIPDAVEEFNMQAGDNSAEFGHSSGAVINAVMKSGTNMFSGDVWEYFRNNALNANDYFSDLNHAVKPKYDQNQFGGTIGGPVWIPKLYDGRNKTFFFFDYQHTGANIAQSFTDSVPTALMQSSGFTNLQDLINDNSGTETDSLGRVFPNGTVFDPATTRSVAPGAVDPTTGLTNTSASTVFVRNPFYTGGSEVGITNYTSTAAKADLNMIPANRIDPNAVKLLNLLPNPTGAGLQNNFFVNSPQTLTINQYDVRVDQTFSAKDTLFGVFDRADTVASSAQPFIGPAGGALQIVFATTQPVYLISLSETHLFSSHLINEARFGFDHNYNSRELPTNSELGLPAMFGIQGIPQIANNGGLPTFNMGTLSAFGGRRFTPTLQTVGAGEFTDNLTVIHGSHEFKFGFQFDHVFGDITQPAYSRGSFTFNGQYTSVTNANSQITGIADFLLLPTADTAGAPQYNNLGGPSTYNGSNYAATNYTSKYLAGYGEDRWKVTPALSLTLGVRWEYFSPFAEDNGEQANLIPTGGNGSSGIYYMPNEGCGVARSAAFNALLVADNITVDCLSGLDANRAQKTNFSPRIGIAYRPFSNFVVRAGYGIEYGAFDSVGYGSTLGTNYPFQYTINGPSTTSLVPITLPGGQTASIEQTFNQINLNSPASVTGVGLALSGKQFNYLTPYTESLNLTVQYQFSSRDAFQVGYVGALGRHLDALGYDNVPTEILPTTVNQTPFLPLPNLAAKSQLLTSNATSNYHSLQASYEHRFNAGLAISTNYTFGKCLTDDLGKTGLESTSYRAEWLPGFGIAPDYSLCTGDAKSLFHLTGEYALPIGKGRMLLGDSGRVVNAFLGGWQLNALFIYESGQPFNIACPTSTTSDYGCNALLVAGVNPYAGGHTRADWLNPAAFAQPAAATAVGQTNFAPLGGQPNQVRGPSFADLDASLFKQFSITEHNIIEFRIETFNTLNHPQFANPSSQLNFLNPTGFSAITALRNNPRIGQLALKYYF